MKTQEELKKLDPKKLNEELVEIKQTLYKLKFDIISGHTKDSHMVRANKKQAARIKTILNSTTK